MMKYLKAEAEIIEFDNSDVVTLSAGQIEDECGQSGIDAFKAYCGFFGLFGGIIAFLLAGLQCLDGWNNFNQAGQQSEEPGDGSEDSTGGWAL